MVGSCGATPAVRAHSAGNPSGLHGVWRIDIRTVELRRCTECFGTGRYPPPEHL